MSVTVDIILNFDLDRLINGLDDFSEDIFQFFRGLIFDSMMAQFGGGFETGSNIDSDVLPSNVSYEELKHKIVAGKRYRWPPLDDFTVSDKRRRGMSNPSLPLVATGRLQESIKSQVTGNLEAQIGISVPSLASIVTEHEHGRRDPNKPIRRDVLQHFGGVPPLPRRSVITDLAETFFDSVADEIGDIVLNIFDKYW